MHQDKKGNQESTKENLFTNTKNDLKADLFIKGFVDALNMRKQNSSPK